MYLKEKRYITLLGDDIEKNQVKASIFSKDAFASVSVNAAVYGGLFDSETSLADMAMGATSSHLRATLFKHTFERLSLGYFSKSKPYLDNETLKSICIDKKPDMDTAIHSTTKYEREIRRAQTCYTYMAKLYPSLQMVDYMARSYIYDQGKALDHLIPDLANDTGVLTRTFDGVNRFNKLSKGGWAIVKTPEHQEDLEEDKTYAPAMG